MKILYISDSHMKTKVITNGLNLAKENNVDKIVLDTDIFDEWNKTEYKDYEKVIEYLEIIQNDIDKNKIIPILANHAYGYWLDGGHTGYQKEAHEIVKQWIRLNKDNIKLIYKAEDYLFSHAGICNEWLHDLQTSYSGKLDNNLIDEINNIWINDETIHKKFLLNNQLSPLWLRLTHTRLNLTYPNDLFQIIGHTPVETIKVMSFDNCQICLGDTHSLYRDLSNIGDESYLLIDTNKTKNRLRSLRLR